MKTLTLMFAMLVAMAVTMQGAAAQLGPGEETSIEDIDGLIAGYSRSYIDNEKTRVEVFGYTFESDDQADAYVSNLRDAMEAELEPNQEAFDELKFEDLEAIDNDGFMLTVTSEAEKSALKILIFTDEDLVFIVLALDTDSQSAAQTAEDFATYVADADVKDKDVSFNDDGTSTGGVFDRMPPADHDLVSDDASVSDAELFADDE